MNARVILHRNPERLSALCDLWCEAGSEMWVTLRGRSMEPTLPAGSRLRLRFRRGPGRPGEVYAYLRREAVIVHRLVAVQPVPGSNQTLCLFQGDGNARPDPPVPAAAVVAVVTETRPPVRARSLLRRLAACARRLAPRRATARTGGRS